MCDDLENAMQLQETAGLDMTKGAKMAFLATAKSLRKLSQQFKEHIEADKQRTQDILDKITGLADKIAKDREDATRYRLVIDVFKALFGTTQKTILTLIYLTVILGLTNIKDIIELLKMFV